MNWTKKLLLTITSSFLVVGSIAQYDVKTLPSFYNTSANNHIISVDMVSNAAEPIVLYTTYNENGAFCKMWDGQSWVQFGEFPEIQGRGQVVLKFNNRKYYALLQSSAGWTLFEKEDDKKNWKVFGNSNFASTYALGRPTLTFVNGNPIIYEYDLSEEKVTIFKYQNGTFLNLPMASELTGVSSDFTIMSNVENNMIMGWTGVDSKSLKLYEISLEEDKAEPKLITKGLKIKEVKNIVKLFYHRNQLYLYYLNNSWDFKVAQYDADKSKWREMETLEKIEGLGFYFASELSFVTKSRENDLPIMHKCNGMKWSKGVEIGSTKVFHGNTVRFVEALEAYYLLNFTSDNDCIVQKIN